MESAEDLYLTAYFKAKHHMQFTLEGLGDYGPEEDGFGSYSAAVTLQRLIITFQAAHLLYRLGLNLEGDAVARQILEQIAWAYAASSLSSLEEIDQLSATKAIAPLGRLCPGTGRLYGVLSNQAHAGLRQHRQHVNIGPDQLGQIVLARQRLADSASVLLRLSDTWVAVCEYTQVDIVRSFRALRSREDMTLNPDRDFVRLSRELVARIVELEKDSAEGC